MFLVYKVPPRTSISTGSKSIHRAEYFYNLSKLRTFPPNPDNFDGGFDVNRKIRSLFVFSMIGSERSESNLDCKLHSFDCDESILCYQQKE